MSPRPHPQEQDMFKVTATKGKRVVEERIVPASEVERVVRTWTMPLGQNRSTYKVDVQAA